MQAKPTMINAQSFERWTDDPQVFDVMEKLHDAYAQLVSALDRRVNVTGWRLSCVDGDVVDALREAGKVPPVWGDVLSSQRWLEAAWATWTAAVGDVDQLLAERKLASELADTETEGGE